MVVRYKRDWLVFSNEEQFSGEKKANWFLCSTKAVNYFQSVSQKSLIKLRFDSEEARKALFRVYGFLSLLYQRSSSHYPNIRMLYIYIYIYISWNFWPF